MANPASKTDGLVKSQKSYDNVAALPELGQGAQPGNDPDGSGRNAADRLFAKSLKLSVSFWQIYIHCFKKEDGE